MTGDRTAINEIAQMLSSPDIIHGDVAEAFGLMREHLHNKYTGKMQMAIEKYRTDASKNPSPEVRLLKAFKPFMDEGSHQKLDELAEAISAYNVFKEMSVSLKNAGAKTEEVALSAQSAGGSPRESNPSVRPDGVYDIDEQCYINSYGRPYPGGSGGMAGIMMLMAAMGSR